MASRLRTTGLSAAITLTGLVTAFLFMHVGVELVARSETLLLVPALLAGETLILLATLRGYRAVRQRSDAPKRALLWVNLGVLLTLGAVVAFCTGVNSMVGQEDPW